MKYIVIRRSQVKFKQYPPTVLHETEAHAIMEARRLASSAPGEYFDVFSLVLTGSATTN